MTTCRNTANAGNTIKGTNMSLKAGWLTQNLTLLCAVVARFRPPNKAELASGGDQIVAFETEDTCSINVRKASVLFIEGEPSHLGKGSGHEFTAANTCP